MPSRRLGAGTLAKLAIAGAIVYVLVDVALVFLRSRFSVLHNAESDYGSSGSYAWVMDLNFLLRCAVSLAVVRAAGLAGWFRSATRSVARGGLIVWALASGLLAFFPDNPVGTATHGVGKIHVALAFIAFAGVIVGTIGGARAVRTDPQLRSYSVTLTVLAYGALVPIAFLARAHLRPGSLGGLYEKIFLLIELLWLSVMSLSIIATEPSRRTAFMASRGEQPFDAPLNT